jgi:hypothetical protein
LSRERGVNEIPLLTKSAFPGDHYGSALAILMEHNNIIGWIF